MTKSLPILGVVIPGNDIVNDNKAGFVYINGYDVALLEAVKQLAASAKLHDSSGTTARA